MGLRWKTKGVVLILFLRGLIWKIIFCFDNHLQWKQQWICCRNREWNSFWISIKVEIPNCHVWLIIHQLKHIFWLDVDLFLAALFYISQQVYRMLKVITVNQSEIMKMIQSSQIMLNYGKCKISKVNLSFRIQKLQTV